MVLRGYLVLLNVLLSVYLRFIEQESIKTLIKAALPSRSGVARGDSSCRSDATSLERPPTTLDTLAHVISGSKGRVARDLGASACFIHAHAIIVNSYSITRDLDCGR